MKLKIKPTRNTIALRKVKFRKESDFNKFLKIVSKNTKELERVKLPSKSDIKKKSGFNLLPILALGALLAGLSKKNKKDTDGVEVPDLNIGNEIDSISNVSMKIKSNISKKNIKKTKTDRKTKRVRDRNKRRNIKRRINNTRKNNITSASKSASTAVQLGLVGLPIDVQQYLTGSTTSQLPGTSTTKTPKLPSNAASRLRTVSDLEYRRLQIKNKIKPVLNTAKVISTVATNNPTTIAGALIVNDIMNTPFGDGSMEAHGYVMTQQGWVHKDDLVEENPWVYSPGKGYESMAEREKKSIDKEIDQLRLNRSQLDPKDTKNYKILTDKISDLTLKKSNITPQLMEQNFIKASLNNPIILYPIDESQNLMLNTPNLYSAPSSQSFTGNNIIDGESDSLNISDLFLLNKLSH